MRLTTAQRRRDLATRGLNRARSELERLRATAKGSKATKQRLTDAAAAEANWVAARPQAAALLAMTAGPLTQQVCTQLVQERMGWCADMRICADLRRRSGTARVTALHNPMAWYHMSQHQMHGMSPTACSLHACWQPCLKLSPSAWLLL